MPGTSGGASNSELFNIELRLRTNFAKVLTQNAVSFESFSRQATNATRTISKSMDTFAQTVGVNMSVVARNTQKEFQNLINTTRSSFNTLGVQSDLIARKIAETYDKIAERKRAAEAAIKGQTGITEYKKGQLGLSKSAQAAKAALDEQLKSTIKDIENRLDADLNAIIKTAQGKIGVMLVRTLAGAIKTLEQQSVASVKVVDNTMTALSNRYKQLQSQMGSMRDVEKLGATKAHYEQMLNQEKTLYQHQEQYRQRNAEAEKRLDQIIITSKRFLYGQLDALAEQHNSKLFRETYDRLKKTGSIDFQKSLQSQFGAAWDQLPEELHNALMRVDATIKKDLQPILLEAYQNTRNIGKGFREAGQQAEQFSEKVRGMGDSLNAQTQAWRAGFADMRKLSTVSRMFDQLWKNLEEQARFAGDKSSKAFRDSFAKGKQLGSALEAYKVKVQQTIKDIQYAAQRGLIDKDTANRDITRLNEVINKIKEFGKTYAQVVKERASVGSFLGFDQRQVDLTGLAKIRSEMSKVQRGMPSEGGINEDNLAQYVSGYKKLETLTEQWYNKKKQLNSKLETLEKELARVTEEQNNLIDSETKAHYAKYEANLRQHIDTIRAAMVHMSADLPEVDLLKSFRLSEANVAKIRQEIRSAFTPAPEIETGIKNLKKRYEELVQQVAMIEKKTFFKKGATEAAREELKKLRGELTSYDQQLETINGLLKRTAELQKLGFQDQQIKELNKQLNESKSKIRAYMQELHTMSTKTTTRIDNLGAEAIGSPLRRGWEMIRNFRWQVAAVIYLIQRAVWFFGRTLGQLFNNIQEYRKSAMSIAAAIAFQMTDDITKAYDKAYAYSRTLMQQLEMTAAKTILTLEDMLMLTKTLAQAGIVPVGQADVDKIATIGVAIKALTEGMANAGVQMRQELYAVIQGRQRATDQLAKMLQLQGVNIKRLMSEAKESGADFLDVLAKKLEPFAEMNRRMVGEWETVKNKMLVVFRVIQRIAAEEFLMDAAKSLDALVSKFYDMNLGKLTEQGNIFAGVLNVVLNIAKKIGGIFLQVLSVIGGMINLMMAIPIALMNALGLSRSTKGEWSGLLLIAEGITYALQVVVALLSTIATIFKTVTTGIKFLLQETIAVGKIMYALWTADPKALWEGLKEGGRVLLDSFDELKSTWKDWFDTSIEGFKRVNDQFDEIHRKIRESNKEQDKNDLGKLFKLPRSDVAMMEQMEKWGPKIQAAQVAGLESFEKIETERQNALKDLDIFQEDLRLNIQAIELLMAQHVAGAVSIGQAQMDRFHEQLRGEKDMAEAALQFIAYINRKAALERKKETERLAEEAAGRKRQFEQFKESISITKDATLQEKTQKWYNDMLARLEELRVKNPLVAKSFKELSETLDATFHQRKLDDIERVNQKIEELKNKIGSKAIKTPFTEANLEAKKLNDEIKKQIDLSDTEKLKLHELVIEITSYKKGIQLATAAWDAQLAKFDTIDKGIEALALSYSPIKQRQAEILKLGNDYNRQVAEINKQIVESKKGYTDINGAWDDNAEGVEEAKKKVEEYQNQIQVLSNVTEREIQKKQIPIWNDLVEASKSWADSFTDALSEIVNGVDSLGEALQSLQMQILQDTVKTLVKNTITEPLQDALGSGLMGEESPFQKMLGLGGKGEKATVIKAIEPIPVRIVTMPTEDISTPIVDSMKNTEGAVNDVERSVDSGNKNIVSALGRLATSGGSSGSGDLISGIFSMFSGSGGSSLGGGGAAGATQLSTGAIVNASGVVYGMAEGGTISEHVVGRGMESGNLYHFGEKAQYGEDEIVAPIKKLKKAVPTEKNSFHMPIYLSAIDTQTGTEFLMKHRGVIQNQMLRGLKNNHPIRRGLRDAY